MFELNNILIEGNIISMNCHILDSNLPKSNFFLKYNLDTNEILSDTSGFNHLTFNYLKKVFFCIKRYIWEGNGIPKEITYAWY